MLKDLLNTVMNKLNPIFFILGFFLNVFDGNAQKVDAFLENLLLQNAILKPILENKSHEIQIIYTQINRNKQNKPRFKSYYYNVDENRYFYPASTVKLPSVLLSLEKLNQLQIDKKTPFYHDFFSSNYPESKTDSTASDFMPTVAHYAKKILIVSDNDAYNRLYDLIGQQAFVEKMQAKGHQKTRIFHRLSLGMTPEENRHTPKLWFEKEGKKIYEQNDSYTGTDYVSKTPILKGKGYMKGDSLVKQPFNFADKNNYPLMEQQQLLRSILFPESVKAKKRFDLSKNDYSFLYRYLSQLPAETNFPHYDSNEYYDSFCKFLMFGDNKEPMPKHIRIFNKVGDAYGFLIDNAYIIDTEKNIEFMLSAVIYCNADGIFNDDAYDYDTIGHPFMAQLGKELYEYESKRNRKYKPDLSKFKLKYDIDTIPDILK